MGLEMVDDVHNIKKLNTKQDMQGKAKYYRNKFKKQTKKLKVNQ